MGTPFLSEIKIVSFNFAPQGWAFCNGQLLPINQNQALFSLLGTNYGGNGQTNFGLPDLRGRVPLHQGGGHTLGERAGEQAHTLLQSELPQHTHVANATTSTTGVTAIPSCTVMLATSTGYEAWRAVTNPTTMEPATVSNIGGSQPHQNMQPFLVLNFCIALVGVFPSQN